MKNTFKYCWLVGLFSLISMVSGDEPVQLFNGKDFTGWHGNNPHRKTPLEQQAKEFKKHWSIKDGVMVNDGEGPYATTDKEYGNVEFQLEYKTVEKGDSGIYMKGTPQIQIWDYTQEKKWKLGADKGSGGLWNNSKGSPGKDPLVLADLPFGEWNHVKVRMIGSRTWVWLNKKLVVNGAIWENFWKRDKPLPAKGPIHLQTHGAEISWRNISIRELDDKESIEALRANDKKQGYEPIFDGKTLNGWAGDADAYRVVDGTIQCKKKSDGGTVYYDKNLKDYSVRFDFKLPTGGNNGLAIRYPGKGDTAYVGMCELQVLDNTSSDYADLDPRQFHGSAYGLVAAERGYLRPVGEWNTQEVTIVGHKIKVELNGSVILDTDVSKLDDTKYFQNKPHPGLMRTEGYFGFAGHDSPVAFRNISIKRL